METRITFLDGEKLFQESRARLEKSVEEQKFIYFDRQIGQFDTYRIIETDTHIYWAEDRFTPRFNGKLFYTNNGRSGISFDKKTRDVKLWFGKRPHFTLIMSFYAYMSCDWYNQLPRTFNDYFTVSLAKDIAKGKIKSIDDYSIHLSKKSLIFKGIDYKVLSKLIYTMRMNYNDYYVNSELLGHTLKVAKNPIEAVDIMFDMYDTYTLQNVVKEAMCISEQIDFSSIKVFQEERVRIHEKFIKFAFDYQTPISLPF